MFGRVYRYHTRGVFGGCTEVTEVSSTGIEFVPNLTKVFRRVLRPYRTLTKNSVGYLPGKYRRLNLVRPHYPTEHTVRLIIVARLGPKLEFLQVLSAVQYCTLAGPKRGVDQSHCTIIP